MGLASSTVRGSLYACLGMRPPSRFVDYPCDRNETIEKLVENCTYEFTGPKPKYEMYFARKDKYVLNKSAFISKEATRNAVGEEFIETLEEKFAKGSLYQNFMTLEEHSKDFKKKDSEGYRIIQEFRSNVRKKIISKDPKAKPPGISDSYFKDLMFRNWLKYPVPGSSKKMMLGVNGGPVRKICFEATLYFHFEENTEIEKYLKEKIAEAPCLGTFGEGGVSYLPMEKLGNKEFEFATTRSLKSRLRPLEADQEIFVP